MKRIMLVTVAVALIAAALAAWGGASPSTSSGTAAQAQAKPKPKLPPLPANIKQRGRWIIGVKCDVPPFGYINVKGQNAGFDVEIARWFARYAFGKASRVNFACAPTPAREPLLTDRPRRPRHLDVHVHACPRPADRLLEGVLQGRRALAREERLDDQHAR